MALYGCMISIHDDAVPRCTPDGGTSLPFRCPDCGPSPRSPAPLPGQHSRGVAAGLGYLDAEVDVLVRMHVLHVEAAAR
jgi:hypothetical protein